MNITEKQKQQLIDLNDSRVNDILELGLKVGKWYKYNNCILNYKETNKNNIKAYGIIPCFGWEDNYNCGNSPEQWIKATKQEIEQALTNEAKRRGFKEGVKFKCLITNEIGEMTEDYLLMNGCFGIGNSLESAFKNDIINGVLFKDGVWAEIIDDKAELTFEEYQDLSVRTCNDLGDSIGNDTHMIFGMVTEVAELADAYKKHWAYGKDLDMVNVKEEIGDVLFYISNFCKFNNINLGEVMYTNVEKLKARYPEKFTNENATNRDLETERKILENGY